MVTKMKQKITFTCKLCKKKFSINEIKNGKLPQHFINVEKKEKCDGSFSKITLAS